MLTARNVRKRDTRNIRKRRKNNEE